MTLQQLTEFTNYAINNFFQLGQFTYEAVKEHGMTDQQIRVTGIALCNVGAILAVSKAIQNHCFFKEKSLTPNSKNANEISKSNRARYGYAALSIGFLIAGSYFAYSTKHFLQSYGK